MQLELEEAMYALPSAPSRIVSRARLRVLLSILAGAALSGCASGGIGVDLDPQESEPSGALMVQNRSWKPMTVYVSKSGELRRLGDVEASSGRVFTLDQLPFTVDGRDGYLVARPLAGEPIRSEAFAFSQGRTTVWTIEKASTMTRLVVR
jgi:hypothetical protein